MALKSIIKAEVYYVLIVTAGVYIPSIDLIDWKFIRDLLSGKVYIFADRFGS